MSNNANNGGIPTFSNIISGGGRGSSGNSGSKPPSSNDFPSLQSSVVQKQPAAQTASGSTREEILISNLLASSSISAKQPSANTSALPQQHTQQSIGSGIMNFGNMEFSSAVSAGNSSGAGAAGEARSSVTASSAHAKPTPGKSNNQQPLIQDQYGMLGMLDVVRMTNQDLSMLALGTDLTSLGLDLNGSDNIYSSFMSPFSESPAPSTVSEPVFTLHSSYTSLTPSPPLPRLKEFSDETMFYIFYAMPRDILQEAAAQELYARSWRFHKEFKLWLTKDPTVEPLQKGPDFERGVYVFFDPATWSRVKLERVLYFDHLEERSSSGSAAASTKSSAAVPLESK